MPSIRNVSKMIALALVTLPALAQVVAVDNQSISGKYQIVYAVWQRSQSGTLMGTMQFDGAGAFTLQGRWQAGSTVSRTVNALGNYRVQPDGTGQITNPMDPLLPPLSLRLGANGETLGGSTLESSAAFQHDLLIALKGSSVSRTAADLNGVWAGVHNVYIPGAPPRARAGRFRFQFGGHVKVSSTDWTFHQSDQHNGPAQTTTSSGSYSVASDGTATFDNPFGRKRFVLSADGNILIGTDDALGQEVICAVKATSNTSTRPTGRFYRLLMVATPPANARPASQV